LSAWEVALTPFPFQGESLEVEVECMHLQPARFTTNELRAQVSSSRPERRRTLYSAT